MNGLYLTLPNDGAHWLCRGCNTCYQYNKVIQPVNTEALKQMNIVCINCLDPEWYAEAREISYEELQVMRSKL